MLLNFFEAIFDQKSCFAFREHRKKPTTMSLLNICSCLIGVYFFYVVGVGRAEYNKICDAMTFMLHYFTLASISWMTVNAVQMYKAFVKVGKPAQYQHCLTLMKSIIDAVG